MLLAVLYLFIFVLFLLLRRELRPPPRRGRSSLARLVVIDPGDTGLAPGAAFELEAATSLGRSGRNTIVLDDAFVSSEHALIAQRDGAWWLTDRGSTNGTYLNDQPVRGDVALSDGDVIAIGQIRLRVAS